MQDVQTSPTLFELDARFRALVAQRNAALDECVLLGGELAKLRSDVLNMQQELFDLRNPVTEDAAPLDEPHD